MTTSEETNSPHLEVTDQNMFLSTARSSILGDKSTEGQNQMTIGMLPDNVLLEIFDLYRADPSVQIPNGPFSPRRWWNTLTQVCRRWRSVIFGSPRRLDLQIVCTHETPTRTSLDIWPSFPIQLFCAPSYIVDEKSQENLIAAVEHRDRISQIHIYNSDGPGLEYLAGVMHGPFPVLTEFSLWSLTTVQSEWVLPETLLGGSAPRLRTCNLWGVSFPSFPKFILSATHIVELGLFDIPDYGHISPGVLVTSLAALSSLKSLSITFRSLRFLPQRLPPPMRVVLPALAFLRLDYVGEFSEDLISRIDAPRLNKLVSVAFCGRDGLPQLQNFIGRTQKLKPFDRATMEFRSQKICMALGYLDPSTVFESEVIFQSPDWQLSPMMQIFSQHLSLLSHVEELEMCDDSPSAALRWKIYSDLNPSQWLLLFHLLIGVKRLRVSKRLIPLVESALQELVGGRTMAVLPALRRLALEGLQPSEPAPEGIASFIAARELSGHPVVILDWVSDEDAE